MFCGVKVRLLPVPHDRTQNDAPSTVAAAVADVELSDGGPAPKMTFTEASELGLEGVGWPDEPPRYRNSNHSRVTHVSCKIVTKIFSPDKVGPVCTRENA